MNGISRYEDRGKEENVSKQAFVEFKQDRRISTRAIGEFPYRRVFIFSYSATSYRMTSSI
jgi:hypothetical protein